VTNPSPRDSLHKARKALYSTYRQQEPLRRISRTLSPLEFLRFLFYINPPTVREVVRCVLQRRLPSLASEMAYYSMLGLFPGILALLTAIGLFVPLQSTFNHLAFRLSEVAPEEVLVLIQNFASEISDSQNRGLFSLSFIFSVWVCAGAMSAAMRAFDQIHQIPPNLVRTFWQARVVSVTLTIGTIVLLVTASYLVFLSDVVIRLLATQSGATIGYWVLTIWRLFSWPVALGIMSAAFAFVYRFGPSRWVRGQPLIPGAVLAALSWAVLSALFRLYVGHFGNYNRVYGAVGAVIILMLWLFLTSLVMLIGGQLNVTVGQRMHRDFAGVNPTSHAGAIKPRLFLRDKLPSLKKSTLKRPIDLSRISGEKSR
jgi:membrane protein